jgi:hypothetical protein
MRRSDKLLDTDQRDEQGGVKKSRFNCKPDSVYQRLNWEAIIHLGSPLLRTSSDLTRKPTQAAP